MTPVIAGILSAARAAGALIVESGAGTIIVLASGGAADPGEHLSLEEAARLAKLPSARPIKDAARAGELMLYGRERSRTVKRADLLAWIEGRRVAPVAGPEDRDITARMARLARGRKKA